MGMFDDLLLQDAPEEKREGFGLYLDKTEEQPVPEAAAPPNPTAPEVKSPVAASASSGMFDDLLEVPEGAAPERGFLGDVASRVARGFVDLGESTAHMVDIGVGGSETAKDTAEYLNKLPEKVDFLKPDVSEATGQEGAVKRGFGGALESAPATGAIFGAGWAGAKAGAGVGTMIGGPGTGTAVGAGVGALVGSTIALVGLFGAGTYGKQKIEAAERLRIEHPEYSEDQIEDISHKNAMTHSYAEVGTEGAGDLAAYLIFSRIPGGIAAYKGGKAFLKELVQPNAIKTIAKQFAKDVPIETGSEMAAAYIQSEADKRAGIQQGSTTEQVLESIIPAIFLSGGIGVVVGGHAAYQRKKAYDGLNTGFPRDRAQAVYNVAATLSEAVGDEQVGKEWAAKAMTYVKAGQSIPLDQDLINFVAAKESANGVSDADIPTAEPPGTVETAAGTIQPVGGYGFADEEIKKMEITARARNKRAMGKPLNAEEQANLASEEFEYADNGPAPGAISGPIGASLQRVIARNNGQLPQLPETEKKEGGEPDTGPVAGTPPVPPITPPTGGEIPAPNGEQGAGQPVPPLPAEPASETQTTGGIENGDVRTVLIEEGEGGGGGQGEVPGGAGGPGEGSGVDQTGVVGPGGEVGPEQVAGPGGGESETASTETADDEGRLQGQPVQPEGADQETGPQPDAGYVDLEREGVPHVDSEGTAFTITRQPDGGAYLIKSVSSDGKKQSTIYGGNSIASAAEKVRERGSWPAKAEAWQAPDDVRTAAGTTGAVTPKQGESAEDFLIRQKATGQTKAAETAAQPDQVLRTTATGKATAETKPSPDEVLIRNSAQGQATAEMQPSPDDTIIRARATGQEAAIAKPKVETIENVDSIADGQEVTVEPTDAQKEAGNYKKAHVQAYGLDIAIENPLGTERSGKNKDGREWRQVLHADYGYVKGSVGFDKDHVDVFIAPGFDAEAALPVFVVNQVGKSGKFDEHKAIFGAATEEEAMALYNSNYEEGWTGGKSVVRFTQEGFKDWVFSEEPKKGETKDGGKWTESVEPSDIEAELDGMSDEDLDALIDETTSTPKPPKTPPPTGPRGPRKTTGQIAKEGGVSAVKGVQEALSGLAELFGPKNTLGSGPIFDEETYAKAKPHFVAAWNNAKDAGHSLKELVQHIVTTFGDVIKPYVKAFLKDVKEGNLEVKEPEEAKEPEVETQPAEEPGRKRTKKMEGYHKNRVEEIKKEIKDTDTGNHKKLVNNILTKTSKALLMPIKIPEAATPGTRRYLEYFRRKYITVFTEYYGHWAGGGRQKWADSFKEAILKRVQNEGADDLMTQASQYIHYVEQLEQLISNASTVQEARDALAYGLWEKAYVDERIYNVAQEGEAKGEFHSRTELNTENRQFQAVIRMKDLIAEADGFIETQEETSGGKNKQIRRFSVPLMQVKQSPNNWRKGKDVNAEQLAKAFGLPDVDFGNWAESAHRQYSVNLAYDALKDLAKTLGAPDKGMSLVKSGGKGLGLYFGAFGDKISWAAAHYDPAGHLINLTKTKGDGSLAHEWGHALDFSSLLSLQDNIDEKYRGINPVHDIYESLKKAYNLEQAERHIAKILTRKDWDAKYRQPGMDIETAREYLKKKWEDKDSGVIVETKFFEAAKALDSKGRDYWSKGEEMFARAFETYIADELQGDNPYLVSKMFVEPGVISAETGYKGSPYPEADERQVFNDLFKRFFAGMEWSKEGIPSMKADFVPVSAQIRLEVEAKLAELEARLEQMYQELNQGDPSDDGLYWYRYKQTARGAMMQPGGYAAYDDEFTSEEGDGKGAIGYTEALTVDNIQGFYLEAIDHADSETTIRFGSEGFTESYGFEPVGDESSDEVEGGKAKDGAKTEAGGDTEGGTGTGGTQGGKSPGESIIDGGSFRPGEGGSGGGLDQSAGGEGSTEVESGPDAVLAGNYRLTDADVQAITESTPGQKFSQNIAAIKVLKGLEERGRSATPEEQSIMARYVGWGGLAEAFQRYGSWSERNLMLKSVLSEEEYKEAQSTVTDSFYTPVHVVKQMYSALERIGFTGGKVLEPAVGTGNFFGAMPMEMAGQSSLMGLDLDGITARLAQKLYPDAAIFHSPYEKIKLPQDHFDLVISNAPFSGSVRPADAKFNKGRHLIHDYYFNKSIDLARPGGLVAMITSTGTMDKETKRARREMSQKAELVGAIRLPSGTFSGNANTQVATDILIFRKKKDGQEKLPETDFVETSTIDVVKEGHYGPVTVQLKVNKYFADHQEMILGTLSRGYQSLEVALPAEELPARLEAAINRLPAGVYTHDVKSTTGLSPADAIPSENTIQDGSYGEIDGNIFFSSGGNLIPMPDKTPAQKKAIEIVRLALPIRGAYRNLIKALLGDESIKTTDARKKLKAAYEKFNKKFGRLNDKANVRVLGQDANPSIWFGLEKYDYEKGEFLGMSDIFTKDTVSVSKMPDKVGTAKEGLNVSMAFLGRVDINFIAKVSDKSVEQVLVDLGQDVYDDPEKGYVTAANYLSGNVRDKLEVARQAAKINRKYEVNVAGLEAAIPPDIKASEITVNLGSAWIPAKYVRAFARAIINSYGSDNAQVEYNEITGKWRVFFGADYDYRGAKTEAKRGGDTAKESVSATSTWGTRQFNFYEILEAVLNGTKIEVRVQAEDGTGKTIRVVHPGYTEQAKSKAEEVKQKFAAWIWEQDDRAEALLRRYNKLFNSYAIAKHDGSHLVLPGKVNDAIIELRKHQKDAVWRSLQGSTYFAHEVGTGKTYSMIAAIMEHRRLGLAKKPIMVVKKATLQDIESDFVKLYPGANVLVAHIPDKVEARKEIFSRIANNDWDAVIVTHEMFEKIPLSGERQASFIQGELDSLEAALEAATEGRASKKQIKGLETRKKALQAKIDSLISKDKDNLLTFEEMGLDMLVVDEAHYFKNLMFASSKRNVKGLGNADGAERSLDMFTKTSYLNQINPGRNIIFASGTPVSNSVSELFSIQRYLQPNALKEAGIHHFDQWLNNFANIASEMEYLPQGGGYQISEFVTGFVNLPELVYMSYQVMDVVSADSTGIKRPKIAGGKPEGIMVPQSPALQEYQEEIRRRAARINASPQKRVEVIKKDGTPGFDIVLNLVNDGRNAAIDVRLQEPGAEDHQDTKVNSALPILMKHYKETKDNRGVQLIFLDRGVPGREKVFDVYNDIRMKLIREGVQEKEIALITDYKQTDYRRLFQKVRNGDVRFLIGSTGKMGTGVNVQDRVVAMHHLDVDWNYANYEQRNGRGHRQLNMYEEIYIYNYMTEKTIDAFMWGKVAKKAKFVGQFMQGDVSMRTLEVVSEETMTASAMMSIAANDPLIEEKFTLEKDLQRLRRLQNVFNEDQRKLRTEYNAEIPTQVSTNEKLLEEYQLAKKVIDPVTGVTINNDVFLFKGDGKAIAAAIAKEIADPRIAADIKKFNSFVIGGLGVVTEKEIPPTQGAIDKAVKEKKDPPKPTKIKEIETVGGFRISVQKTVWDKQGLVFQISGPGGLKEIYSYDGGLSRAVTTFTNSLDGKIEEKEKKIAELTSRRSEIEKLIDKPFPKAEDVATKSIRLEEVNRLLVLSEAQRADQQAPAAPAERKLRAMAGEGPVEITPEKELSVDYQGVNLDVLIHKGVGTDVEEWVATERSTGMKLFTLGHDASKMTDEEVSNEIVRTLESYGAGPAEISQGIGKAIKKNGIVNPPDIAFSVFDESSKGRYTAGKSIPALGATVDNSVTARLYKSKLKSMLMTKEVGRRALQYDDVEIVKLADQMVVNAMGEAFNKKIVLFRPHKGANLPEGLVDRNDPNVLYVNIDKGFHPNTVFGHELLHIMKKKDPALYKEFSDMLKLAVKDKTGGEFNKFFKALSGSAWYDEAKMTREEAWEELMANFLGDSFTREDFWQAFQKKNPGLLSRMVNLLKYALNQLASKVRKAFGLEVKNYEAYQYFKDIEGTIDNAARIIGKFALKESAGQAPAAPSQGEMDIKASAVATPERRSATKFIATLFGKPELAPQAQEILDGFRAWAIDSKFSGERLQRELGPQKEKHDFMLFERLRGKIVANEAEKFVQEQVDPLMKHLAKNKLEISDMEELGYALHAPEANLQARRVNAKRNILEAKKSFTEAQWREFEDRLFDIENDYGIELATEEELAGAPAGDVKDKVTRNERRDKMLLLLDDIFSAIPEKEKALEQMRAELEERVFTREEEEKGTPERLQAKVDREEARITALKEQKEYWDYSSPRLSGITDEEAASIVEKWNAEPRKEAVYKAVNMLAKINKGRLDLLRESGHPPEEVDAMAEAYEHYVPLYREGKEDKRGSVGAGIRGPLSSPVKGRVGSIRKVTDIFAHTVDNYLAAISLKHKRAGEKRLFDMVKENPDPSRWQITKIPKVPHMDKRGNIAMYPDPRDNEPNEMFLTVDGKKHLLTVNEDNKNMLRFVAMVKETDVNIGPILRGFYSLNRFLAGLNTMFNPEFIVTNFMKDAQTAGIHMQDTAARGLQLRAFKNLPKAIAAIYNIEMGKKAGSKFEKTYEDFKEIGAKISWMQGYDTVTDLAKNLESDMDQFREGHALKKGRKRLMKLIGGANTAVENGIRLALYAELVGSNGPAGMTRAKAAEIVSNLTVDFTRRGKAGPAINSLFLFGNAGIQGTVRMLSAVKNSRSVQRIVGGIIGLGVANFLAGVLLGGDDDDGYSFYEKLKATKPNLFERNMVFIIPDSGGKTFKIPLPYGYNAVYNIGVEMAASMYAAMRGNQAYDHIDGAARVVNAFVNSMNPLAGATILQTISPTVFDPIVQAYENKGWHGGNLMPEKNPFDLDKPDSERYFKNVNPLLKSAAQALNSLGGGTPITPAKIPAFDISPATMEMVIETYTGGVGRLVKDTLFLPVKVASGDYTVDDVPFVRKVAGGVQENMDAALYRKNSERVEYFQQEYKAALPEKRLAMKSSPEYKMMFMTKTFNSQVRKISQIIRDQEIMGAEKEQIAYGKTALNKVYRDFNRKFKESMEN